MRILGIDCGSSSIKAVEMDSAFGRYDIHDYHEGPINPDVPVEFSVAKLIKGLSKAPDRIVVAMQPRQATFRNLVLPTRDKKSIKSGVGFELEDELPFPLEDCTFQYAILAQNKQGSSVHVAASLKRHLLGMIQGYHKSQLEPDIITTEAWAYRTLLNRVLGSNPQYSPEHPVLLVQMGHSKTTFYLHWHGAPGFIREFTWGGRDLTAAICKQFGISLEEAETAKVDRGFVSASDAQASVTPEQSEFSRCLENSLSQLIKELKQAELMCRNVTQKSIKSVLLAGGTALLPGLGAWIEERIKLPTQPLLALSSITSSGVTYSDQTDARFLLAASLALSQVGPERALCVNFRQGEFNKESKSREINFAILKKPLLAVGTVAACLFLSLVVQSSVYQSQLKTVDIQLEKSVRSFFGQLSTSGLKTYMSNPSLLRTSINKELTKQRELNKLFGQNTHSPLDFLNTLSAAIPKDVVVDLYQFQAGISPTESFVGGESSANASLTFVVPNPQTVDTLANLVGSKLQNVQRGKTEEVAAAEPTGIKKWKITFSGKPTEDSYGK